MRDREHRLKWKKRFLLAWNVTHTQTHVIVERKGSKRLSASTSTSHFFPSSHHTSCMMQFLFRPLLVTLAGCLILSLSLSFSRAAELIGNVSMFAFLFPFSPSSLLSFLIFFSWGDERSTRMGGNNEERGVQGMGGRTRREERSTRTKEVKWKRQAGG